MTFEQAKQWLLATLDTKSLTCPYKVPGIDRRAFVDYKRGLFVPCAKITRPIGDRRHGGGMLLDKHGEVVLWWFDQENSIMLHEPKLYWSEEAWYNNWHMDAWNLTLSPWIITNWIKAEGLT